MVFEGLAEKLQDTFDKLRGKGKLSEEDVKSALKEVRMSLLEADVNYRVVKDFINNIEERAVGEEVMESLTPAQQVIKIVKEELTELMGGEHQEITFADSPPTVIMLVGLQGSGKTTSAGKLANHFKKEGKSPLLVAADVYRPAAIDQLEQLGKQLDVDVFQMGDENDPVDIVKGAVSSARSHDNDIVIVDTAGRLHIDEELMDELSRIKGAVDPEEIMLVVDAMTGQDAVNVAERFTEQLDIDGMFMTKLDGDARGGAALSIREVTGRPIKYAGVGEKLNQLETFHPDRMASRILGMGDMLSLIERAEESFDEEQAKELEEKLREDEFTLEDFLDQMDQVRNMGPIDEIMGMIPGMGAANKLKDIQVEEEQLDKIQAIIQSMTEEERRDPDIIDGSRRRRIASGSGTEIQDVNRLLKQFRQTRKMMKQLNKKKDKLSGGGLPGGLNLPF
ncbi:signal recognition particle protein [Halarsenatibacter silvermanii]|uniref:Signal recognition particle protein n=1 Tax=Halarsenatibacter silvermanii TaxID=321763 RepID=A0A1G9PJA2_9FIRM|nr:signal recognition particle protein [Halarsenatibacter silvermanii]SDL98287.1 signal recognition particle subunit FFH/SRP54 (srp54) [Halarsenatibacter silvermanii]